MPHPRTTSAPRTRHRCARLSRWPLTILSLLLLTLWAAQLFGTSWLAIRGGPFIRLERGAVWFWRDEGGSEFTLQTTRQRILGKRPSERFVIKSSAVSGPCLNRVWPGARRAWLPVLPNQTAGLAWMPGSYWDCSLPLPAATLITTALSAAAWWTALRNRPRPHHRCPHCRYDLTGLPESTPCPECGTETSSTQP